MKYFAFFIILILPIIAFATAISPNYGLYQEGLGFTELSASSTNYQFNATIGEPLVGVSASTNYILNSGKTWGLSTSTATTTDDDGGGGGGGGGGILTTTRAEFSGLAYSMSKVSLLKDGQVVSSVLAGPDAKFFIAVTDVNLGDHLFSLIAEDNNGVFSKSITLPLTITSNEKSTMSGLYLTPTLVVDKDEVKHGDNIAIFGQTAPNSQVTIGIASEEGETFHITESNDDGTFLYNLDTISLETGEYEARAESLKDGKVSEFSYPVHFSVSDRSIVRVESTCPQRGDLNGDCKVNIIDFSIAVFWYKEPLSSTFTEIESAKLSGDGFVDLVDLSIIAFYWTG